MAYITASQLQAALASFLKIREADLPDYWQPLSSQAANFARQEIVGRLLRRGFTEAQVDAWDRDFEFSRDLGLWKAVVLGGAYTGFDANVLKALDRRRELDEVLVFISGVWVKPTGDQPSLAATGPMAESAGGLFGVYPDADDISDERMQW